MGQKVVSIHPAMSDPNGRWIDDFADPASGYEFSKIAVPSMHGNWHARGARTTFGEWLTHVRHAVRAMTSNADIVVANFPPLTFAACLLKRVMSSHKRIFGGSFNFGPAAKSKFAPIAGNAWGERYSDEAAGRNPVTVLNELEDRVGS